MTQEPTLTTATRRVSGIRDMLADIPLLAAEVLWTEGAPNPGDNRVRTTGKPGSRTPGDLDVFEVTVMEAGNHTATLYPLPRLAECSRLIWEALDPDEEEALGRPGDPGWTNECSWLWAAWPIAQSALDASAIDWVHHEIASVYAMLADKVRLHREKSYTCPKCGDAMRLQEGGQYLRCDSGHEESANLEARYRRMPALPLGMAASVMGVNEATLRTWKHRRRLTAARVERGTPWFFPWDVLLLKHPDIAEAVNRREGMGA